MVLNIFRKIKQKRILEKRISDLINNAEECIDSNLKLGIQYLKQANNNYPKLGYNFEINCRLNNVCLAYAEKLL